MDYEKRYYKEIMLLWKTDYVMILILWVRYKNDSCIRETQENSIKSSFTK